MSSSKQPTVTEASPSPPPLPNEPLPETSLPVDQPITEIGDGDDDEDDEAGSDEEWDPAEVRLPGDNTQVPGKGKGKGKEVDPGEVGQDQPWQAVWSPEKNGESISTSLLTSCMTDMKQLGISGIPKQVK